MNLEQIKEAVENNKIVRWINPSYTVLKSEDGNFTINRKSYCVGLTAKCGKLMDKEDEFYIDEIDLNHISEKIKNAKNTLELVQTSSMIEYDQQSQCIAKILDIEVVDGVKINTKDRLFQYFFDKLTISSI